MSIPEISVAELVQRLATGDAALFDVRNPDEFAAARVPGARLVPLGEVTARVDEFPTDREVLVIRKSGGRSAQAAEFLRSRGVDATNIAGGTLAWIDAGHRVETGGTG